MAPTWLARACGSIVVQPTRRLQTILMLLPSNADHPPAQITCTFLSENHQRDPRFALGAGPCRWVGEAGARLVRVETHRTAPHKMHLEMQGGGRENHDGAKPLPVPPWLRPQQCHMLCALELRLRYMPCVICASQHIQASQTVGCRKSNFGPQ